MSITRIMLVCILISIGGLGVAGSADAPSVDRPDAAALPEWVDLRPALKAWQLPPRRQGARGTCSVFAITGAMEYALAARHDRGQRLSVEYLNWASNRVLGINQDGGFFADLWKGYAARGICTEQAMPYQKTFDPNRLPDPAAAAEANRLLKTSPLRLHWIKHWNPHTGLRPDQLTAIKRVLSRTWPVCGGFRWPKTVRWQDGVLNIPPPDGVFDGHSVLLVGYRDDPRQPGGGVFIFRNSSHRGPENRMPYAYAAAYMNDAVWIDPQNTPNPTATSD